MLRAIFKTTNNFENHCLSLNKWKILYFIISLISFAGQNVSLTVLVHSFQFMRSMGSPKMGEGGQVLDPGVDLNMEGGLAEHAKVTILIPIGLQVRYFSSVVDFDLVGSVSFCRIRIVINSNSIFSIKFQ